MNCPECGKSARYVERQGNYFCSECRKFFMGPRPSGRVAPMRRRTAAFLVDMVLVLAAASVLLLVLPEFSMGPLLNSTVFTFFSVMGIYFVVLHAYSGQTVGKRLFRVRVALEGGSVVPADISVLRYLLKAVSMLALGLGLLWAFFNSDHKGWHDRFAETVVLEV